MELIYVLLVLLAASRIFAEIAERMGQPPLVGELVAGVGLGMVAHEFSDMLPVLSNLSHNEVFEQISDLAIFFLMMLAGLELRPREMAEAGMRATIIAIGGMLLPLAAGFGLAAWFLPQSEYWPAQAMFLAVALSITAVPVAVRVLMDLGELNSVMGRSIVSAAVVDDALSLVLLAVLTAIIDTGSVPDAAGILRIVGQTTLFFVLAALIGQFGFPLIGRVLKRMRIEESDVSALLIAALAYALLAEMLGVHFILGAFLAGLFFGRRTVLMNELDDVRTRVKGITTGFFAPIFFTSIGLHLSGKALMEVPVFVLVLIAAALLSKLVGAGVAARMTGSSRRSALIIGTAMSSRGAVELIIADIALRAGLFDVPEPPPVIVSNLFSSVIIMAITTTIVAPVVMRRLISRDDA